jgi:hypothetical protein
MEFYRFKTWNFHSTKRNPWGIKNIKPNPALPITLFLFFIQMQVRDKTYGTFKGGLDLKYGINDAFTLDMILIPDFGQTNMMIRY